MQTNTCDTLNAADPNIEIWMTPQGMTIIQEAEEAQEKDMTLCDGSVLTKSTVPLKRIGNTDDQFVFENSGSPTRSGEGPISPQLTDQ